MRIEHLALWTDDLARCIKFYQTYFGATAGAPYANPAKGFESCFLSFATGPRIEVMRSTRLTLAVSDPGVQRMGWTHIAISLGSEQLVNDLTHRLRDDGFPILDGPRRTGDGYYESTLLDPDGNRIELTV